MSIKITRKYFRGKADILKNVNHCCEMCGSGYKTQIHHKDMDRSNNSPDNAQVLCFECHREAHGIWTKRLEELHKREQYQEGLRIEALIKNDWIKNGGSEDDIGGTPFNVFYHNWIDNYYSEREDNE